MAHPAILLRRFSSSSHESLHLKPGLVAPSFLHPSSTSHLVCLHHNQIQLLGSPHSRINSCSLRVFTFTFSFLLHQFCHIARNPSWSRSLLSISLRPSQDKFLWPTTKPKPLTASAFAIHPSAEEPRHQWPSHVAEPYKGGQSFGLLVVLRRTPSSRGMLHHDPLWISSALLSIALLPANTLPLWLAIPLRPP